MDIDAIRKADKEITKHIIDTLANNCPVVTDALTVLTSVIGKVLNRITVNQSDTNRKSIIMAFAKTIPIACMVSDINKESIGDDKPRESSIVNRISGITKEEKESN